MTHKPRLRRPVCHRDAFTLHRQPFAQIWKVSCAYIHNVRQHSVCLVKPAALSKNELDTSIRVRSSAGPWMV